MNRLVYLLRSAPSMKRDTFVICAAGIIFNRPRLIKFNYQTRIELILICFRLMSGRETRERSKTKRLLLVSLIHNALFAEHTCLIVFSHIRSIDRSINREEIFDSVSSSKKNTYFVSNLSPYLIN